LLRTATRSLPIRWRLTFWYLVLLIVIMLVFAGTVTLGLRFLLHQSLDNTLENQAALLTESIDIDDGEPKIGDRRIRNRPGQQFVRLVDHDGELLTDSNPVLDDVSMDDQGLQNALNGFADLRWRTIQDERMRVLSQPVMAGDEVVAVVQVGLAGRSVETVLNRMIIVIVVSGLFVLALAAAGGLWLAGRTLRPIDRMTRLAARIGDQDLSRRIDLPPSNDELGRLARTFNAMLDRLEQAMVRQREFTAAASHELRTPLAMIQSQLDLALAHDRDPVEDHRTLENLQSDVIRLTRISNTLLSLARSDAGEMELTIDQVELHSLMDLLAEQYAPLAEPASIELEVFAVPVSVYGDEDRLIQLLVNLMDNAFQHSSEGGTVRLECLPTGTGGWISVSDQGSGIEPRHLPHVFERFFRSSANRSASSNGAGLGLTISKMIVDAHGGSIDISSEPGSGTTVEVWLPGAGPAR
jgi:heavy metal sensor kinase